MIRSCHWLHCCGLAVVAVAATVARADDDVDFRRHVEPLLAARCSQCHGADKREGGLRLTSRDQLLLRNDSGEPALVPGRSDASELIRRVTAPADSGERMPPEGDPLPPAQIDLLRRWIDAGAEWPDDAQQRAGHWAFRKPQRPELPAVKNPDWCRNEIDRFILARLEAEGLTPSPPAEPARLLRRLHLDLIGLPPTLETLDAFLADPSPEHYARIVDALLASPRYGERWARPWLDLARYADSNGYQADQFREIWAFRDWVINAINDDLPFDQFTIEQLAGDLLPDATLAQRIATGFHRCTTCNVEAGVDPEENRVNQIVDRVNTTGAVWLGITLECAQCHNHKYDPFTQQDYYQLFAFFNNTPLEVEQSNRSVQYELSGPRMPLTLDDEQAARREQLEARLRTLTQQAADRRQQLREERPDWERRLTARISSAPSWHLLTGIDFTSQGEAAAELLEDGSLLIAGPRPDKDVYTLTCQTPLSGITGFKLECLTHPSLSRGGPGRPDGDRPNFVAYELEVTAQPAVEPTDSSSGDDAATRVPLHTPVASFSQTNWSVEGLIDGDPKTGWAINPQFGKDHWMTCLTAQPITHEGGTRLTFRIPQTYGGARTIGRLRLFAMTGDPGVETAPEEIRTILALPATKRTQPQSRRLAAWQESQDPDLARLVTEQKTLQQQITAITPPTTLVMTEMPDPRLTRIFKRGDFLQPTAAVEPGTPDVLHPLPELPADRLRPDRLVLAEWLVSPENPLTPRVTVNRWWAEFFGRGIVPTLEDFGTQGEPPAHPELLDWLALQLVEHGWSMKQIHRAIVLSAAYQQEARVSPELLQIDPYNALLTRGPRLRLAAEAIRDQALAVSGLLATKLGGPPVYPPQPPNIWRHVGRNEPKYETDTDEDRYRRGVYVVYRRSAPYPSFVTFDAPDRGACCVQRSRTNTPLQALTLLNDPAYVEMAWALAQRIMVEAPNPSDRSRAEYAFKCVLARQPASLEVDQLVELVDATRKRFAADPRAAAALVPAAERSDTLRLPDLIAWFYVANVLLNLDETVTKG